MNEQKTKLKLYKALGSELGLHAQKFLRKAFNVKYTVIDSGTMTGIIKLATGLDPLLYDHKFYLTDWETWKQILEYDWTPKSKYIADRYDCDNFAGSFNSRMAEIYGLNSAGRFTNMMNYQDGRKVPHRATVIVTSDNKLYALEPQEHNWCLVEKGKPIIISDRAYEPKLIAFN